MTLKEKKENCERNTKILIEWLDLNYGGRENWKRFRGYFHKPTTRLRGGPPSAFYFIHPVRKTVGSYSFMVKLAKVDLCAASIFTETGKLKVRLLREFTHRHKIENRKYVRKLGL